MPKPTEPLGYDSLPFNLPPTRERRAFDADAVAKKFPNMGRASGADAPVSQRFGRATPGPSAFIRDSRVARDSDEAAVDREAVLRSLIARLPEDERARYAELLLGDAGDALDGRSSPPAQDADPFPHMRRLG